jgi:hypothetical protein
VTTKIRCVQRADKRLFGLLKHYHQPQGARMNLRRRPACARTEAPNARAVLAAAATGRAAGAARSAWKAMAAAFRRAGFLAMIARVKREGRHFGKGPSAQPRMMF